MDIGLLRYKQKNADFHCVLEIIDIIYQIYQQILFDLKNQLNSKTFDKKNNQNVSCSSPRSFGPYIFFYLKIILI